MHKELFLLAPEPVDWSPKDQPKPETVWGVLKEQNIP